MAFRLMLFVLFFNLASGILGIALLDYYPTGLPKGIAYDSGKDSMKDFTGQAYAPGAESSSGWWNKFLDFIKLSFFQKIISILDSTIYGILGLLQNIGIMPEEYNGYFYTFITIIYAIGIIDMYTGRKIQY